MLSHRTAAALWKLVPSMPPFVEVTVTRRGPPHPPRPRSSTRRGDPPDVRTFHSLPVTAPLRTLVDLAATQPQQLERSAPRRSYCKLVTHAELDGARIIDPDLAAPTRSQFERMFFAALRRPDLPRPLVEPPDPLRYTADFAWPESASSSRPTAGHSTATAFAFEDDRARDAYLAARGWIVVRITWRRLQATSRRW